MMECTASDVCLFYGFRDKILDANERLKHNFHWEQRTASQWGGYLEGGGALREVVVGHAQQQVPQAQQQQPHD